MRSRSRLGRKFNPLSFFARPRRRSWQQYSRSRNANRGFTLIVVVFIGIMLIGLITAYMLMSKVENTSATASADSSSGFYAAEAGLNLRARNIFTLFDNRGRPSGTSPASIDACTNGSTTDNGTGDFQCVAYNLSSSLDGVPRNAVTYMVETTQFTGTGANRRPIMKRIPPDEPFAGLNAQENSYQLNSVARKMTDPTPQTEAILTMDLKSRVVPMFQFAAFYDKDLEILPSPVMTLAGPVHTNGDLYLGAANQLTVQGQLTVVGSRNTSNTLTGGIYNSRKDDNSTYPDGRVRVNNPSATPVNLLSGATGSTSPTSSPLTTTANMPRINTTWGSQMVVPAPRLQMPDAGLLSNTGEYYCNADLRISYTPNTSTNVADTNAVRQSVPMTIAKVDQTTRTTPCTTTAPSTNGATVTDLTLGERRSLLQPILGSSTISAVASKVNYTIPTDPSTTGTCNASTNPLPCLTTAQKAQISRALQVSMLAQSTPIPYSSVLTSAISALNAAPYTVDTLFSGGTPTYSATGTSFLDQLLATSGFNANFGADSSGANPNKTALKTALRNLTPAQIAAMTAQAWFPAAFMDVGGLQPTTYYNDREAKEMRLLQVNLESLTIWNKDGVYLNYDIGGTVSDSPSVQFGFITGGFPSANSANQKLFTLDTALGGPTGSFQQLGYAGSDTTDSGYVVHMTIDPGTYTTAAGTPASPGNSPYGFILSQGSDLFGLGTSSDPTGVTFSSDQGIYVQGDLNSINKQPAATLSDTLNVLSNACSTPDIRIRKTSGQNCNSAVTGTTKPNGTSTVINAGFLAGTDETNSTLTSGYNGGLENYPRFSENWGGQTLTYRGSFVSLGIPQKVRGRWGLQSYSPPARNWGFDIAFNDANNLPPLDPRFVYLKQDTFIRSFQ